MEPLYNWFTLGLAVWLTTYGLNRIWLAFKTLANG